MKDEKFKIATCIGGALALIGYLIPITSAWGTNLSLFDLLRLFGDDSEMLKCLLPQVLLTAATMAAILCRRDGVAFGLSLCTFAAYGWEVLYVKDELNDFSTPLVLHLLGAIMMVASTGGNFTRPPRAQAEKAEPNLPSNAGTAGSQATGATAGATGPQATGTTAGAAERAPAPSAAKTEQLRVKCVSGEMAGAVITWAQPLIVGRDAAQCNLVLQDPQISPVHCRIVYEQTRHAYLVTDHSTGGTFADGNRLVKEMEMEVAPDSLLELSETTKLLLL